MASTTAVRHALASLHVLVRPASTLPGATARRYDAAVATAQLERDGGQEAACAAVDAFLLRAQRYGAVRRRALAASAAAAAVGWAPVAAPGTPRHMVGISAVPRGLYLWGPVGTGKTMVMDWAAEALAAAHAEPLNDGDVRAHLDRHYRPPHPPVGDGAATSAAAVRDAIAHATASTPLAVPVRRVHFHAFLQDAHARIHAWKQADLAAHGRTRTSAAAVTPERDAIAHVARAMAQEAWLLALDEIDRKSVV